MLCCDRCEKPVLLLTGTQPELVEKNPDRYRFVCTDCVAVLEAQ